MRSGRRFCQASKTAFHVTRALRASCPNFEPRAHARLASSGLTRGAFIMQVVDIGLSEIDAFSVQYARAFKPRGFRLTFDHSSNWRLAV